MSTGPITLTVGWISRHTPPGAGVDGRDAAVIDISQDLLLRAICTNEAALTRWSSRAARRCASCMRAIKDGFPWISTSASPTPRATPPPSCSNLSATSTERVSDRSPTA